MRVISVIHFPEYGGPHNQSGQLAGPLAKAGIDSITVVPEGPGAERIRSSGAQVRTLNLGRIRAVKDLRTQVRMIGKLPTDLLSLMQLFRHERPDVVQLNGLMNPHAAIAARSLGIPVVWQLLDTRPPLHVRRAMAPAVNRLADVLMPIGFAVARAHPGITVGEDRSVVFYPPADTERFVPGSQSTLRDELGIPESSTIIGCVANVNPQKGYEYFVDAAAMVRRSHPDTVFIAAGRIYANHPSHGPYFDSVLAHAVGLGLTPGRNLFFLDARSDIVNVMNAIDIFMLSSVPNSEGTPTVILEAMSSGKPVVATDVGSVREVVAEGNTGFVVPSQQPSAMAGRIANLLDDPALRATMGRAGRSRVENEFSLDRCVAAHQQAYERAIAHRRASRYCRV